MAKCFPAIWVDVKEGSEAAKESKKYKPIAEVQLKKGCPGQGRGIFEGHL